jgi:tRNA (guanine37-N1)-methyltransferase
MSRVDPGPTEVNRLDIAIVTLFPELFSTFLRTSFVHRAIVENRLGVLVEYLREHGRGKHRSVDDTPYGGGAGMVMRVDCVLDAIEAAEAKLDVTPRAHRVLLTPQGKPFCQADARTLATRGKVVLVCGRYEGFDERTRSFVDEEISLGDFVLTGGEIPAMAVIEACIRMIPGVLGNDQSSEDESFSAARDGLLEYPQYTRPVEFRSLEVPGVLKGGNHAKIEEWRKQQSLERTRSRRPDLLKGSIAGEKRSSCDG